MKKLSVLVVILSFLFIGSLLYEKYFINDFIIKGYTKKDYVEVDNKYTVPNINICYGNKFKCDKVKYKKQGSVNSKSLGTYTITYRAKYNGKKIVLLKKVEVLDKQKPNLVIIGDFNKVCPNGKVNGVSITANDNYDGNISSKVEYKIKGNKIIYKVSDSSSNTTTKEFDIIIKDEDKPSLILDNGNVMYLPVGSTYKEPGYVAIDNCDGDITSNVKVTGSVDTSHAGTYVLTYSVSDVVGNVTSAIRTIKVYNKNNYEVGKANGKIIYLTFDDGPGPYTATLLDTLARYNVKATFFVIGTNTKYDDMIKREYNEGHTVGLHSYSHRYNIVYSGEDAYFNDLNAIKDKVKNLTGYESKIIRFPGGSSNTVSRHYSTGIMSILTNKVEELGYRYFDWTISAGDAGGTTNPTRVYQNVINNLKENVPNVILMHDIKSYTVDAVPMIIEYGLANGYTFAPLSIDSPIIHQSVNN